MGQFALDETTAAKREAMRSAVDSFLTEKQQDADVLEKLSIALHRIGDGKITPNNSVNIPDFVIQALELCGHEQLKTGKKTLHPYWRETAIEAGLNPTQETVNTVDANILTALSAMKNGQMPTAPSMEFALDNAHTITLGPVDGLINGFELVMESVSADPAKKSRIPVRPINEILKSEAETHKAVAYMFSETSSATSLDGYLTGMELAKLKILREHPEFVKDDQNPNQAETQAEILQSLKVIDQNNEKNKKVLNSLAKDGYLTKLEIETHAKLQEKLQKAKETGDLDKILTTHSELSVIQGGQQRGRKSR